MNMTNGRHKNEQNEKKVSKTEKFDKLTEIFSISQMLGSTVEPVKQLIKLVSPYM